MELKIELSEELFSALRKEADKMGLSVEDLVVMVLSEYIDSSTEGGEEIKNRLKDLGYLG